MLRKCFLVNLGTGEEAEGDLAPQEVVGEDPQHFSHFLGGDCGHSGFVKGAQEGRTVLECQ